MSEVLRKLKAELDKAEAEEAEALLWAGILRDIRNGVLETEDSYDDWAEAQANNNRCAREALKKIMRIKALIAELE